VNSLARRLSPALISGLGGKLVGGLMASCSYEYIRGQQVVEEWLEPRRPAVYLLWHGRLLPCSFGNRRGRLGTLISRNRDGDHIAAIVEGWGYRVVRGSSSRGGSGALRELVRLLRQGIPVAVTPDGPRGPRQKMKQGPLLAARLAGVPIIAASAGASSAWYFGRWDRFLVPRPFTWIPMAFSEPIYIDPTAGQEELSLRAIEIEDVLNGLTKEVDEAARSRRS